MTGALGIAGLRIGLTTDLENNTGCTVLLPAEGSVGAMSVRGGAPGTREAAVLSPTSANTAIHAVTLCGSSLFGLRAASGVADWCAANDIGLDLNGSCFPIVGGAVVFDIASPDERRIDHADGWAACEAATTDDPAEGRVGAGTGCTVGKEAGREHSAPGGQGIATVEVTTPEGESIRVSAIMIVNAVGSIYDNGELVAGCRAPEDTPRYPFAPIGAVRDADTADGPTSNTVIGCVVTNARLTKASAARLADLAHTGIARTASPAHTNLDGDAMFAIGSSDGPEANPDLLAHLAAEVVAGAVVSGVRAAARDDGV